MNKTTITALFFLMVMNLSFGQKTDFQTTQIDDVLRTGLVNKPTLDDYPYLAVSILFRNEDKLSDKQFLGQFNKMNFFSTDIEITYGDKTEKCPLYFLKKEKGKFSTTVFKDRTVVRKIPIRKYSESLPNININMDVKIKNESVAIIKSITDKVTPIIQNPASIYGSGAAKLCFGFLTDVVSQLNDTKEINAKVGFDAFNTDDLGIIPYSYKVVILRPNIPIPQDGYSIKLDIDGKLKLFRNNSLYTDYPYFIIQMGLSNYLDEPKIPSIFYKKNGNCNITTSEFNNLSSDFDAVKNKLSDDQIAAEQNILNLYSYKLAIEEGVQSQGGTPNEEKLLKAYNSLYDFRYKSNQISVKPKLYADHYEQIFKKLMECIRTASNQLSMYKFLSPVFAVLDKEDIGTIDNSDLGELKSYIENTKTLNFILKSNFNSNAVTTITGAENKIFNSKFDNLIKSILQVSDLSGAIQTDIKNLITLKNQYDKCSRCQEESQKAEKHFNDLVKTEKAKRDQILEVVADANVVYSKGFSALLKLEFIIKKSTDSNTGKPKIVNPITKEEFIQLLESLKVNKEKLNSKLLLTTFTQSDKFEIDQIIAKCYIGIKEINNILDTKITPLFDKNTMLFTSS